MTTSTRWRGLSSQAQATLTARDYAHADLATRLATTGLEGSQVLAAEPHLREAAAWIPGVELFHRPIHPQRQRGVFGEFAREGEGALGRIGLWPRQWATARMFARTAKGFHVHPPFIPENIDPAAHLTGIFSSDGVTRRPYDREQWDVMFIVQGRAEMFLVDERAGFDRRRMRFTIDGDDIRGSNTLGVVIPPGVAHALRGEGSTDVIMVYGTSTTFDPANEGRIAAAIEQDDLPAEWNRIFIPVENRDSKIENP
jgi:dTDP-4-dehydrorhamnose 3,5-epimerase-like enzyme